MMFSSPDTLISDQYNPLDWNRYLYARANPLRYTDPTGHAVDEMMEGGSQREYWYPLQPIVVPEPAPLKSSTGIKWCCTMIRKRYDTDNANPYLNSKTLQFIDDLLPMADSYSAISTITEAVEFADNFERPVFKRWKGSLPGGPFLEGLLGATGQLAYDLEDRSRIRTTRELITRSIAAGAEDGITEYISDPVMIFTGTVMSPLGPVGTGAGFLLGGNATTWFMDNIIWQPINQSFHFHRP